VLKRPPALHQLPQHQQYLLSNANDDSDDDDDFVQDMHVGPNRIRITKEKKSDIDDDELSPYVTVRLAVARAKAMARYREVWG